MNYEKKPDTGIYHDGEKMAFVVSGKQTNMEEFIELHQLPKDTTIEELFEFCRKQAE